MDTDYRSLCNAATLQSDKRGFFFSFAETVEAEAGPDWVKRFRELPSDRKRLEVCLVDPKVCQIVHGTLSKVQKIFRGKAAKFARTKMEEADHWLKKGKLDRALASANLAVIRAPIRETGKTTEDSTIASQSLWIRSEILFKMFEYQHCLTDVQLSLKHHLNGKFKAEAYQRMGLCYLFLGDKKKCTVSLNVARSCGNNVIQEECDKVLNDINNLFKKQEEKKKSPSVAASQSDLPGISCSAALCFDPEKGRYMKASGPISVGDIVSSEEPYVSALQTEKHGTHCLNCFNRLKVPIPCPDCSGVAFCSNDCLLEGMKFHKWECPYIELQIGSGMSVLSLLSLRIVTQQSLDYFKKVKGESDAYHKVLKLESHSNERDGQDLLRRALMALFLLQILRHSGYFNDKNNGAMKDNFSEDDGIGRLSEDEYFIGGLLFHHLKVLQYNSHEIYETVVSKKNQASQGKTYYIALALYLGTANFNHQCQPTLARYFCGKRIILQAQRPISIGEEINENYGPVFTMRTREQRQKVLSGRYLFNCTCQACILDWPILRQLTPDTVFFRCKQKSCSGSVPENGKCQTCGKISSTVKEDKLLFLSYQEDWSEAAALLSENKYEEAEKIVILYVKNMWELVTQPSKNLSLAMEALRTIWANKNGNLSILSV